MTRLWLLPLQDHARPRSCRARMQSFAISHLPYWMRSFTPLWPAHGPADTDPARAMYSSRGTRQHSPSLAQAFRFSSSANCAQRALPPLWRTASPCAHGSPLLSPPLVCSHSRSALHLHGDGNFVSLPRVLCHASSKCTSLSDPLLRHWSICVHTHASHYSVVSWTCCSTHLDCAAGWSRPWKMHIP